MGLGPIVGPTACVLLVCFVILLFACVVYFYEEIYPNFKKRR